LLAALLQTLVIPLIPALPTLLNASPADTPWVVTITLLVSALVTPIGGRLGDLFGKRRVLLWTLTAATTGTIVSAVTTSLLPMVIGRGLQGCAMAGVPLALGILKDVLPPHRTGPVIALLTGTLGLGGAIGIPLAGLVAQHYDWHVLFWGAAGLGLLCILLTVLVVPEAGRRGEGHFDRVGALGLTAGLIGLILPIVNGGRWGWGSLRTLILGTVAVLILLAWSRHQLRVSSPLVDLRLSTRRPVLMANLATVASGFSIYTMLFVFPQILQAPRTTGYGFGLSLVWAGTAVAPNGLAALLVSPFAARLIARHGARVAMMLGAVVIAAGYILILVQMDTVAQFVVSSCIIGAGAGISVAATSKLITDAVPVTKTGSANGVNSLMRSFGSTIASAVLAAVLAQSVIKVESVALPSVGAFQATFVVGLAAAVLVLVFAILTPRALPNHHTTEKEQASEPVAERIAS
jgi:MFS family permease